MYNRRIEDLIKIKEENPEQGIEYELKNGELLALCDWNGEVYIVNQKDGTEVIYRPICQCDVDETDISEIEENSEEWNKELKIIGFEKD